MRHNFRFASAAEARTVFSQRPLGDAEGESMSKRIWGVIFAAAAAACFSSDVATSWAFEQVEVSPPPENVLDLVVGVSRMVSTADPFAAVDIADPNVVDAKPETDKTVLLVPKAAGETTVYFFDQKRAVLSSFIVRIAPSTSPEVQPGSVRANYVQVPGRVKLHNLGALGGVTYYQCTQANCELVQVAPLNAPGPTESKQTATTKGIPGGTTTTTDTTTSH